MKFKVLLIQIILMLLIIPSTVLGVESGAGGSGNTGTGAYSSNQFYWPASSVGLSGYALRGVRITMYEFANNQATAKKSIDFFSNKAYAEVLNKYNINYYSERTSRLEYARNNYNNINYGKINTDIEVIADLPIFGEPGESSLRDFFDPKGANFNKAKVSKFTSKFKDYKSNDDAQYYYVVEPTTLLIISGKLFYGTAYEHVKFVVANNVQSQAQNHLKNHIYHMLPMAYYTSFNTIPNPDTANFNGFLNSVGATIALNSTISNCNASSVQEACVYESDILKYTIGMGILWQGDLDDLNTIKETCEYVINVNECGNIGVNEPNSRLCTIGREQNHYSDYDYKDAGKVYCSNTTSTSFEDFYKTFGSVKRAGGYFPMNDLVMTNTKTCYIVQTNNSVSVSGWETAIENKDTASINIKVGNLTYNLVENKTSDSLVCQEKNNGVCTKATITTKYNYSLNYLTNRFISIGAMKQDDIINENNCTLEDIEEYEKCQNLNPNTIYNEKPSLTVPLNYINGVYKYKLDLSNSIFKQFINRTIVPKDDIKIKIGNNIYILNYITKNNLKENDLIFNCPYKVTQDQCEDENGNIIPCLVEECENLPDDKCCIDGKESECPKECIYECCDENGKEIPCPGGDSFIDKVIYRPISLINPFPGIEGDGRDSGSNWVGTKEINGKKYNVVDYYITNNRGYKDYELYQQGKPLYVIELNSQNIKEIREYNKKHNYNDFDLTCVAGEKCISNFLRGNVQGISSSLLTGGECKDKSFDDCVTRKGA